MVSNVVQIRPVHVSVNKTNHIKYDFQTRSVSEPHFDIHIILRPDLWIKQTCHGHFILHISFANTHKKTLKYLHHLTLPWDFVEVIKKKKTGLGHFSLECK